MTVTPHPKDVDFEYLIVDQYGRKILTLGEFRRITARYNDDVHIVVDDGKDWWNNVQLVGVPDVSEDTYGESAYSAISLQPGDPIDTRQF